MMGAAYVDSLETFVVFTDLCKQKKEEKSKLTSLLFVRCVRDSDP